MKYLTTTEAAAKWGISARRVAILCETARVMGIQRVGKNWIIPEDAQKPSDARIKSGRYIKSKLLKKSQCL